MGGLLRVQLAPLPEAAPHLTRRRALSSPTGENGVPRAASTRHKNSARVASVDVAGGADGVRGGYGSTTTSSRSRLRALTSTALFDLTSLPLPGLPLTSTPVRLLPFPCPNPPAIQRDLRNATCSTGTDVSGKWAKPVAKSPTSARRGEALSRRHQPGVANAPLVFRPVPSRRITLDRAPTHYQAYDAFQQRLSRGSPARVLHWSKSIDDARTFHERGRHELPRTLRTRASAAARTLTAPRLPSATLTTSVRRGAQVPHETLADARSRAGDYGIVTCRRAAPSRSRSCPT